MVPRTRQFAAGDPFRLPRRVSIGPLGRAAMSGGAFVVAVSLLYGSTLAPSPRGGLQPIEFSDEAYYAVLGRDLAERGTETNLAPSGFPDLVGEPAQVWYHWGELWLASAVIVFTGTEALPSRYLVVLPMLLLAAAALSGTLVRRMAGTDSRRAYVFGFLTCLFLAPIPIPATFFSSFATGLMLGISIYGLSAVAVLIALVGGAGLARRKSNWSLALFLGATIGLILPAHIAVAALAAVGAGIVIVTHAGHSLIATRRLPALPPMLRRTLAVSLILLVGGLTWGVVTGHGSGASGSAHLVEPFNAHWQVTIALVYLGAAAMLAIPIAALLLRRESPLVAWTCYAVVAQLAFGAIAWGASLQDFVMYHLFFAVVAVFATPVAAVAVWTLIEHLRRTGHERLARSMAALCVIQLGVGVATAAVRLQDFGPHLHNDPVNVGLLQMIKQLPPNARMAYACRPFEEFSFVDSSLLGIDAHTGRRVVPMCYEADIFSVLNGLQPSDEVPAAGFLVAPQSKLYPDADAHPSPSAITAFLRSRGIDFIYADARHPNVLVPGAIPIAAGGGAQILRLP